MANDIFCSVAWGVLITDEALAAEMTAARLDFIMAAVDGCDDEAAVEHVWIAFEPRIRAHYADRNIDMPKDGFHLGYTESEEEHAGRCATPAESWYWGAGLLRDPTVALRGVPQSFRRVAAYLMWATCN